MLLPGPWGETGEESYWYCGRFTTTVANFKTPYIAVVRYLHLRFWFISRAEKEDGFFSSIHLTPIEVTALEFIEISLSAELSRK